MSQSLIPNSQFPIARPLGFERDWVWRGWQIRYTYIRSPQNNHPPSMPIVFLHGFGSALTQWRSNLLPLSQVHSVYALDMLGFGASEKAAAPYKVDFWVEQVHDFWQTLIGQPIILVGHSLGALVALAASVAHPEMIHGLVLITLPGSRQELRPGKMQAIANRMESFFAHPIVLAPAFRLIRQPRVLRSVLRLAYANPDLVTDEIIANFVAPALDRGADRVFFRLSKAAAQPNYSPETKRLLTQLQKPILMMWGEQDRVIPLTWGRQLPQLNPNLQLIEIPDAGHCPYDECPDRVNQEILNWMRVSFPVA